ncbi:MAG TPA: CNNM domain-containing protein [Bacillota bacterium]|nr:CNNM domain-containing protein [Bacillota bacterium]
MRQAWKTGTLTFFMSIIISTLSRLWTSSFVFWLSIFPLFLIIGIGILFDMIGTAVTAASEMPFHAMAADKVHGAKRSIKLVRNADRVANFCNDVIGDICGTASGALATALVITISIRMNLAKQSDLISVIVLGFVAALTVAGKAYGKSLAIQRADWIIFRVGKALATWDRFIGGGHNKRDKKDRNKKKTSSRKRETQ